MKREDAFTKQAVDYVSSLQGQALDGFWLIRKLVHPLIRFEIKSVLDVGRILSSMTSSLIRLSLATTNSMSRRGDRESDGSTPASNSSTPHSNPDRTQSQPHPALLQVSSRTNPIFVLCCLRMALQKAQDLYHWDLTGAPLARADNVATVLESVDDVGEYTNVVYALRGALFGAGSFNSSNEGFGSRSSSSSGSRSRERSLSRPSSRPDSVDTTERGVVSGGGVSNERTTSRGGGVGGADGHGHGHTRGRGHGSNGYATSTWNIDLNLFGTDLDWSGWV